MEVALADDVPVIARRDPPFRERSRHNGRYMPGRYLSTTSNRTEIGFEMLKPVNVVAASPSGAAEPAIVFTVVEK